jgi:hypothetical protein
MNDGNIQILRYRRIETFAFEKKSCDIKELLYNMSHSNNEILKEMLIYAIIIPVNGGQNENTVYKGYEIGSIKIIISFCT